MIATELRYPVEIAALVARLPERIPGGPVSASPHSLAVVTGTSSGIGQALARELLGRGWAVVGIARRSVSFDTPAYAHVQADLADFAGLAAALEATVRPLLADPAVHRVGLVNNAAAIALLGPVQRIDPGELSTVFAINTTAPVFLMGWLLRHCRSGVPIRIVNVSTGAAARPMPGLGAYASSKAALRMAGMILAAELDARTGPVPDATILSYEPGIVDTAMQSAARSSTAEMLPIVQTFKDWAATGSLAPPTAPAAEIADYLAGDGHPRWMEGRFGQAAPSRT